MNLAPKNQGELTLLNSSPTANNTVVNSMRSFAGMDSRTNRRLAAVASGIALTGAILHPTSTGADMALRLEPCQKITACNEHFSEFTPPSISSTVELPYANDPSKRISDIATYTIKIVAAGKEKTDQGQKSAFYIGVDVRYDPDKLQAVYPKSSPSWAAGEFNSISGQSSGDNKVACTEDLRNIANTAIRFAAGVPGQLTKAQRTSLAKAENAYTLGQFKIPSDTPTPDDKKRPNVYVISGSEKTTKTTPDWKNTQVSLPFAGPNQGKTQLLDCGNGL